MGNNKVQGSIDIAGDGSLVEAIKEIVDAFLADHLETRFDAKPEIRVKEDRTNYYKLLIDVPLK